jgi:hypothetical protein
MEISFLPGELCLKKASDGTFTITIASEQVFSGKNEKKALTEYNRIRKDMEEKFPPIPLTPQQRTEMLMRYLGSNFHANTFKPSNKDKKPRGSTRTFG